MTGWAVVPDLLRERAAADPGTEALVVDGAGTLDLDTWERRSNRLSRGLVARGIHAGDRVALHFDNARWLDYAVACFGVQKAGAIAVPLAARYTAQESAHVLAHCGAVAVVSAGGLVTPTGGAWVAAPAELEHDGSDEPFQVPVGPQDLAEIIYTSGTTGLPAGVACSHESILFYDPPPEPESEAPKSFLHCFPVGTNACQEALRRPLRHAGATAVTVPFFDPERFCALVAERRIARLQLVPATAQVLVASGAFSGHDLTSVERVTLSSAPSPPALFARLRDVFPRATFWNTYALTEAGTARTLLVDATTRPASVGRPVGGTEVRVVDEEGREVPAGVTGEIWLRRKGAPTRQYYRDPEATAARFAGGWLRTGDLGYLDDEGYVYLADRKKDLIISGGLNVSSVEVENVLCEHPAVVEAAVFGTHHEVLGQDVAAAVVAAPGTVASELQAFVRARLGEHKVPHALFLVDDLPRTASGKVKKRVLRETLRPRRAEGGEVAPARTATEHTLASIWAQVLDVDAVGRHDDFFELGGHSLAAAQVVARVHDELGVELSITAVFEGPTVAEVAAVVDAAGAAAAAAGAGTGGAHV